MLYEFQVEDLLAGEVIAEYECRADLEADRVAGGWYPAEYNVRSLSNPGKWLSVKPSHRLYSKLALAFAGHSDRVEAQWHEWLRELHGHS